MITVSGISREKEGDSILSHISEIYNLTSPHSTTCNGLVYIIPIVIILSRYRKFIFLISKMDLYTFHNLIFSPIGFFFHVNTCDIPNSFQWPGN